MTEATLRNFTIPLAVDMVSVSFCRSAEDIRNDESVRRSYLGY